MSRYPCTRAGFLAAYEAALRENSHWAGDAERLAKYMTSVRETLAGANTWTCSGTILAQAWHAIGGSRAPSLKGLRALPMLEPTAETVETVDGPRSQLVIPGAERSAIQARQLSETRSGGRVRKGPNRPLDIGLFADPPQRQLFDVQGRG